MTKDAAIAGSKRRRWTGAEKAQIVRESLIAGMSVAELARRYDVNPNLIYAWRHQTKKDGLSPAAESRRLVPVTVLADREGELQRGVMSATISIEFEVGARVQIAGIPDPATLSNVLICLAAAERRR
jgi:transposase